MPGDEAGAQLLVVVDLAVEDDHLGSVFVEDRLPAAAQVDDAEATHPETDGPVHVQPLVIRPTMPERGAHAAHQRLRHGSFPIVVHDACDAAHMSRSDARPKIPQKSKSDAMSHPLPEPSGVLPRRNRYSVALGRRGSCTSHEK